MTTGSRVLLLNRVDSMGRGIDESNFAEVLHFKNELNFQSHIR